MSSHADQQSEEGKARNELANRFVYHPATKTTGPQHEQMRLRCYELARFIADATPPGRHQALALTAVEEAMHWANAAIACDTPPS